MIAKTTRNNLLSATLNLVFDNNVRELGAMYRSAVLPNGIALAITNLGCGSGGAAPPVVATQLVFSVSGANATAGTVVSVTVRALDASGALVTTYAGTMHFTRSDAQATVPADSKLTGGTGTFSLTLRTIGSQTVTATDTVTASLKGTTSAVKIIKNKRVDLTPRGDLRCPADGATASCLPSATGRFVLR